MPLHSIDASSRLSAVSSARIRMNGDRALEQHQRIAGADEIRQLLGVAAGAEHRHRQVAEARVLGQQREEGVDRSLRPGRRR